MHLIINSVFLIAFQFINLSNFKLLVMVLWVNDRCKWIIVILINLCDNLLYYMIYLRLLSFVFVSLSSSYFSATHPVPLPTLWFYCPLWLVPILLPNYHTNIFSHLYSLSYLYNIREIVTIIVTYHKDTNTQSQSQKIKNTSIDSLKHKPHKHRFWDFEG